jgi:uncharacterized protein
VIARRGRPGALEGGPPPVSAPHQVRLPVNVHHWENISFLHWPFDPADIAPLVPDRTAVLTLDGKAWVGVTPFVMKVRPPGVPVVPPGWAFPETNMRTYVSGPDGREGLWFLHMEVTAAWFVATLRSLGLPYVRQRMTVDAGPDRITYRSKPRGRRSGGHDIVVRFGAELDPPHGQPRDRFLTARWGAYHRRGPLLLYTPVTHPPWPLRTGTAETCEVDGLFRAAGLPAPAGPPVVHFSRGVKVKVGRPQIVRSASPG